MSPTSSRPRKRAVLLTGLAVFTAATLASTTAVAVASAGSQRLAGDNTQAVRQAIDSGKAKNVILLIGDGMGDSEITIAREQRGLRPPGRGREHRQAGPRRRRVRTDRRDAGPSTRPYRSRSSSPSATTTPSSS